MKTIASALMALSILASFGGQAMAYDADTHDARKFFDQRDREAR